MPDEPNKKMDELLKAYAQERRKAPELYLHPATRKMLQSEVSRALGPSKAQTSWIHRLRSFWPQIAFAGSLCLILGVAVLSLRQPPPQEEDKIRQEKPPAEVKDAYRESAAPAPDSSVDARRAASVLKQDEMKLTEAENLPQLKKEQLQPAPESAELATERMIVQERQNNAVPRPAGDSAALRDERLAPAQVQGELKDQVALESRAAGRNGENRFYDVEKATAPRPTIAPTAAPQQALSAATEAVPSPTEPSIAGVVSLSTEPNASLALSSAEKLARANEMTNLGAARRLQFVQTGAAAQTAPTAMFSSFQMEQLGTNVRFLDRDGSVYFGLIGATNLTDETSLGAKVVTAADTQAGQREVQQRVREQVSPGTVEPAFTFRASGTNRTLGRNVVLTGQFFETTNGAARPAQRFGAASTPSLRRSGPRQDAQHMIIGTAVVGETNRIPLRAVSQN